MRNANRIKLTGIGNIKSKEYRQKGMFTLQIEKPLSNIELKVKNWRGSTIKDLPVNCVDSVHGNIIETSSFKQSESKDFTLLKNVSQTVSVSSSPILQREMKSLKTEFIKSFSFVKKPNTIVAPKLRKQELSIRKIIEPELNIPS